MGSRNGGRRCDLAGVLEHGSSVFNSISARQTAHKLDADSSPAARTAAGTLGDRLANIVRPVPG